MYTPERRSELLLSNAVDAEDYARAREEVTAMRLDPDTIPPLYDSRELTGEPAPHGCECSVFGMLSTRFRVGDRTDRPDAGLGDHHRPDSVITMTRYARPGHHAVLDELLRRIKVLRFPSPAPLRFSLVWSFRTTIDRFLRPLASVKPRICSLEISKRMACIRPDAHRGADSSARDVSPWVPIDPAPIKRLSLCVPQDLSAMPFRLSVAVLL